MCLDCAVGMFTAVLGSSICSNCPNGKIQNSVGQSFCIDCDSFSVSSVGLSTCNWCDYQIGFWKNSSKSLSSCSSCGPARFLDISNSSNLTCVGCSSGLYNSFGVRTTCDACQPGNYSDFAKTECSRCSPGSFSVFPQSSNCTLCAAGTYSTNMNSTGCLECSPGSYQSQLGSSFCLSCPRGYFATYSGSTLCQQCEGGTTEKSGSLDQTYCVICNEGYYGSPPRNPCTKCPKSSGMSCPQGVPIPYVNSGYWRIDAATILECSPTVACESTGTNNITSCAHQYTGTNCGACNDRFYRLGLDCKKCPAVWTQTLTILAFLIVLSAICARLMLSDGKLPPDVRVAIQAMQLMSLYNTITPKWPPYVKTLINALSFTVSRPQYQDFLILIILEY
jgi:hypothetical protein